MDAGPCGKGLKGKPPNPFKGGDIQNRVGMLNDLKRKPVRSLQKPQQRIEFVPKELGEVWISQAQNR